MCSNQKRASGDGIVIKRGKLDSLETQLLVDSEEEDEVFLRRNLDTKRKMPREESKSDKGEDQEIVVPENVTMVDLYKMLATMQQQ